MMYINLIGRLGVDSELKTSKNGKQFVSMRVASDDFFGGENVTTWVNVLWSGERALKMQEHMKKGSAVVVMGKPKFSLYTTRDGEKAISVDIFADRVDFAIGSGNSGTTQASDSVVDTNSEKPTQVTPSKEVATNASVNDDDDLPF